MNTLNYNKLEIACHCINKYGDTPVIVANLNIDGMRVALQEIPAANMRRMTHKEKEAVEALLATGD